MSESLNTKDMRRVLASGFAGSMVEYYDFLLYATASAIVFGPVFFKGLTPAVATLASFTTLAAGYLTRPLGGVLFGHFGDRYGRKSALIVSLVMMGTATVLIGLIPPASVVGMAAPVALLVLRMIQGVAVGGEWGGAVVMSLEHAPPGKRTFAAAFANAGGPAGAVLATMMMSAMGVIAGPGFLTWGWRVPFLLSAVLIAIGLVIRLRVAESPVFRELQRRDAARRVPVAEVFGKHSGAVVVSVVVALSVFTTQGIITVWGVSVAIGAGEAQTAVLNWKAIGAVLTMLTAFASARIADRAGRRIVLIAATAALAVLAIPLSLLIGSGHLPQFAVAVVLGNGIAQGLIFGPSAAYVAELFPAAVRYSGAAMSYQAASALGAGLSPALASSLMLLPSGGLWWLGAAWAAIALAGTVTVAMYRARPATGTVGVAGLEPAAARL